MRQKVRDLEVKFTGLGSKSLQGTEGICLFHDYLTHLAEGKDFIVLAVSQWLDLSRSQDHFGPLLTLLLFLFSCFFPDRVSLCSV